MSTDHFEKTPKKADRWFWIAIVSSLLYGITFSLFSLFNWIFFCISAYAFFMSYYLLPVQPKIFQQRRKQDFFGGSTAGGRGTQSSDAQTQQDKAKRMVTIIVITGVAMIFFFLVLGIFAGDDSQEITIPAAQRVGFFGDHLAARIKRQDSGRGSEIVTRSGG